MYPGEGVGQLGSFYTVIVAVIIGVDRLLYYQPSLCNSNSSQKFCRTELYKVLDWTEVPTTWGSNVNILYGGEERRGTSKKIK